MHSHSKEMCSATTATSMSLPVHTCACGVHLVLLSKVALDEDRFSFFRLAQVEHRHLEVALPQQVLHDVAPHEARSPDDQGLGLGSSLSELHHAGLVCCGWWLLAGDEVHEQGCMGEGWRGLLLLVSGCLLLASLQDLLELLCAGRALGLWRVDHV